ncbi:hypothetical protein F442_09418 [Phytophthora nicotianae P10297]|uniref:Uncharacterized protein n=1 Tax=Phytophthora nicotianae P10297 TaxID=1317064 RepID=W2ZAG4_PHYNI|nr:hypothetical protein F442_09418 [Phytophthora nicotianae P10297]
MVKRKKLPPGEVAGIVTDESVMLYDIGHLMGKSDIGRIATKYRCGAQTVRDILNGKSLSGCLSSSRLETGQEVFKSVQKCLKLSDTMFDQSSKKQRVYRVSPLEEAAAP